MAQPQMQQKDGSLTDPRRTATIPATQSRGMQRGNPMTWAGGPFGLMRRLSDDMDQLFGELTGSMSAGGGTGLAPGSPVVLAPIVEWIPALDIFERDGQLLVQADLPGVAADNVTVEVDDGLLTVSGERREEREVDSDGFRRLERRYGKFSRSIALPEGAKADEISASYRDGVLEITMPLAQPTPQRRTINIKSAAAGEAGKAPTGAGANAMAAESEPAAGAASPQTAASGS